jgi:hypothetical protein
MHALDDMQKRGQTACACVHDVISHTHGSSRMQYVLVSGHQGHVAYSNMHGMINKAQAHANNANNDDLARTHSGLVEPHTRAGGTPQQACSKHTIRYQIRPDAFTRF